MGARINRYRLDFKLAGIESNNFYEPSETKLICTDPCLDRNLKCQTLKKDIRVILEALQFSFVWKP